MRVAREVPELVDEDRAELRPVPVLGAVERDLAQGVVRGVAVVAVRVGPRRLGVLVAGELAPGDVDVALARVHPPVVHRDLASGLENDAARDSIIRVTIKSYPHRMITGSFFALLPGYKDGYLTLKDASLTMRRE